MKIKTPSKFIERTEYRLMWETKPGNLTGYAFPCDKHGVPTEETIRNKNYQKCVANGTGLPTLHGPRFVAHKLKPYHAPAVGICDCGAEVELDGFTNTCGTCGADYNSSGQRFAPREQWGAETGEHPADVARIK